MTRNHQVEAMLQWAAELKAQGQHEAAKELVELAETTLLA